MKKATLWIVIVVVLAAALAWYFYKPQAPEEHPSVISLPEKEAPAPEPEPEYPIEAPVVPEEPEPEPLPSLEESDQSFVDALAGLLDPGLLEGLLIPEQVISRIVATVDSLDSSQLAPLVLPVNPAAGKFQATGSDTVTIHPENAQRYDAYVRIAEALDAQLLLDLYRRYYPLFVQAYSDLGYADVHFNDRLVGVIGHLLATPALDHEPSLVKPEAVYLFEDPDLEALSAGQKLLLRIGPDNSSVIRLKLEELHAALTTGAVTG